MVNDREARRRTNSHGDLVLSAVEVRTARAKLVQEGLPAVTHIPHPFGTS